MRAQRLPWVVLVCCLAVAPVSMAVPTPASSEIDDLLDRADLLLRLGTVEHGATRAFGEASALLDTAIERLAASDESADERRRLTLEIEAIQEHLDFLTEFYGERFFGTFPLARVTVPTLLSEEGLALSEQLYHPPQVAATEVVTQSFLAHIDQHHHPHVIVRSPSENRALEILILEILIRDGRITPHTRRDVVRALNHQQLESFDQGVSDPELVDRLATALDAINLFVLTIKPPVELEGATSISLRSDFYLPGEVVQGSPLEASLEIRSETSGFMGFARDRRELFRPIIASQLLLLALAMAWATQVSWSIVQPLRPISRLAIGASLFALGRIFIVLVVFVARKVIPDSNAMVAAAGWWPALLGLLAVLGGGLMAWIGQARLTDIVPGARGARAVGSVFALVAMGTSSYFVTPLLLLEKQRGFASLIPFVLASVILSVVFGFAARTGPPVPHYFAVGPLALAPLLGLCVFMVSPRSLWMMVGLSGSLGLAAWARHRYAVAHGTEEPEPTAEEAAQADHKMLDKLSKNIKKKI